LPLGIFRGPIRNLNVFERQDCDGTSSARTVYDLSLSGPTWTYKLLCDFSGNSDGRYAFSNLVMDKQGNLYDTTNIGGANDCGRSHG